MKKICSKCGVEKEINCFNTCKKGKDGFLTYCKSCKNEIRRKNTNLNKEKINEYKRNYLILNSEQKEKHKERCKKYYHNNKNRLNKNHSKWEKSKRKSDKLFLLKRNIKTLISNSLKRNKNNRTSEILGCTYKDFKKYIEDKWSEWMNWDNYGLYNGEERIGWDLDHIIPISSATTKEELVKLNHYTNFQPLCSKINRDIKKNKII